MLLCLPTLVRSARRSCWANVPVSKGREGQPVPLPSDAPRPVYTPTFPPPQWGLPTLLWRTDRWQDDATVRATGGPHEAALLASPSRGRPSPAPRPRRATLPCGAGRGDRPQGGSCQRLRGVGRGARPSGRPGLAPRWLGRAQQRPARGAVTAARAGGRRRRVRGMRGCERWSPGGDPGASPSVLSPPHFLDPAHPGLLGTHRPHGGPARCGP